MHEILCLPVAVLDREMVILKQNHPEVVAPDVGLSFLDSCLEIVFDCPKVKVGKQKQMTLRSVQFVLLLRPVREDKSCFRVASEVINVEKVRTTAAVSPFSRSN